MVKPKIKICTPFYNEFQCDSEGFVSNDLRYLPCETSIKKLLIASECIEDHYEPLKVYETEQFYFQWQRCKATNICMSRNVLINLGHSDAVNQIPPEDFTHYLCLDTDIAFTAENITRLLSHNLPVVSGAYISKGQFRRGHTCYTGGWFGKNEGVIDRFVQTDHSGIIEVDWCGAGFLLIQREVFEKMSYPWFRNYMTVYSDSSNTERAVETEEDVGFCIHAGKTNIAVYLDCDTVVDHVTGIHEKSNEKKKLSDLSTPELKSLFYDQTMLKETIERRITMIRNEIDNRVLS